jgi:hypothetical protein
MPDTRPGGLPGGVRSVPIGEAPPAPPNPDPGHPVQFRGLARWGSAKPVRFGRRAGATELTGQFYVIRLRGTPLMPPPKTKPGEVAPKPHEGMLQAIPNDPLFRGCATAPLRWRPLTLVCVPLVRHIPGTRKGGQQWRSRQIRPPRV